MNAIQALRPDEIGLHLTTPLFRATVARIIERYKIQRIIESGTNDGTGSTAIFAQTGLPVDTIELKTKHAEAAKANLAAYPNVRLHHGNSTHRDLTDPVYGGESLPEMILPGLLENAGPGTLIFLDSHWMQGFDEFRMVYYWWRRRGFAPGEIILFMDDATNRKHSQSVHFLQRPQHGKHFVVNMAERWAWTDFSTRSDEED